MFRNLPVVIDRPAYSPHGKFKLFQQSQPNFLESCANNKCLNYQYNFCSINDYMVIIHFWQSISFTKVHIINLYTRQNSLGFGIRDARLMQFLNMTTYSFHHLVPGHYHTQLDKYCTLLSMHCTIYSNQKCNSDVLHIILKYTF